MSIKKYKQCTLVIRMYHVNYSTGPYEYKDCLLCYGLLLFQRDLKMRKNLGCFAIKSVDLRF